MDSPSTSNNGSKKDKPSSGSALKPSSKPRIVTMDSIRNTEDDEKQAFFAGGSEHSGQQILGKGKRKNDDSDTPHSAGEALAEAFRQASSISSDETSRLISYYPEPQMFSGVGHRLGDSEHSEAEVIPGTSTHTSGEEDLTNMVVTLWQDGFCFDDGPLVPYDDKKCKDLKDNVEKGEWTSDILPRNRSSAHLSVVDKRDRKYEPSIKVFGGKGHLLGSPTPTISTLDLNEDLLDDISIPESNDERRDDNLNGTESHENINDSIELLKHKLCVATLEDGASSYPDETERGDDESVGSHENQQDCYLPERNVGVFSGSGDSLACSSRYQNGHVSNGSSTQSTHGGGSGPTLTTFSNFTIEGTTNFSNTENSATLKIRLPDGHSFKLTVNASSTIAEIKKYLKTCIPALRTRDFGLQLAYPLRELSDDESANAGDIRKSIIIVIFKNN